MESLYVPFFLALEVLAFALLFLLWWSNRSTGLVWAPFWLMLAWLYGWIANPLAQFQNLYFSQGRDMTSSENFTLFGSMFSTGEMVVLIMMATSLVSSLIVLLKAALAVSNLAFLLKKVGIENPVTMRLAGLYSYHRSLGLSMLFLSIVPGFIIRFFFKF